MEHAHTYATCWGWRIAVCIAAFFGGNANPVAQSFPAVETLTMEEGLSFRDVTAIAQDHLGLMWFGTLQGLSHYDGYSFTTYYHGLKADIFFPGQNIRGEELFFMPGQQLWMNADGQLYILDLNTHEVELLEPVSGPWGRLEELEVAKDGSVWAVVDDEEQLFLQKIFPDRTAQVIDCVGRTVRGFSSLESDPLGRIWWSTESEGLRQYDSTGVLLDQMRPDSFFWYGHELYYTLSFIDSRNRHFLFPKSKNEVQLYDEATGTFETFLSMPDVVYLGLEDDQHNLWFATSDDLFRVQPDGKVTDMTLPLKSALDFSAIRDLFEDRTHNLWVATNNGLLRLPIRKKLFDNYLKADGAGWGNTIRGMFEDAAGNVFFFCESRGELFRLTPGDSVAVPVKLPRARLGRFGDLANVRYLAYVPQSPCVFMVDEDLLEIRLTDGHIKVDTSFASVLDPMDPNPVITLADERLLLGHQLHKLTIFNTATNERRLLLPPGSYTGEPVITKFLMQNRDGKIWVGTTNRGVFRLSLSGRIEAVFNSDTDPSLSNDHVLAIAEDEEGLIWVGTFGGGLNRINPITGQVHVYTRKEGLCDDNVVGIIPYGPHHIWISTYNGLACLDKRTGTFRHFYQDDGLSHNEFNYTSFLQDSRGRFYFGGMNGVNAFYPAAVLNQEMNPPLCLTRFSRYNRRTDSLIVSTFGYGAIPELVISPYDSYFQIDWTLPNYLKPESNQYYTWLENYEPGWIYQGGTPFIRYHSLPPGEYVLHVKGADARGNWSEAELAIPLRVRPIFLRTWWFILILLAFVTAVIYGVFRYRLHQLMEMQRMRTKISSDLHDDVGAMLSGMAMQAELMEMEAPPSFKERFREMSELSRKAVAQMRDLVWAIDSRRDSTTDLLERMREHAEETLLPRQISFELDSQAMPPHKKLPVAMRQHLYLIFKEAIVNVARHSNGDHVRVKMGNAADGFELSIYDNGHVPAKDYKTTGLGLSNMKMRAEKIGAVLEVKKEDGFLVHLKMSKMI